MTELETQLLAALSDLETQYNAQHSALEQSQAQLHTLCRRTLKDNEELRSQVHNLSKQVERLSALLHSTNKHS